MKDSQGKIVNVLIWLTELHVKSMVGAGKLLHIMWLMHVLEAGSNSSQPQRLGTHANWLKLQLTENLLASNYASIVFLTMPALRCLFNSNSMLHSNEYTSPSRKHTSLEITSNVMNNICAISKVSYLWCTFTVLFQLNVMSRLALSILKTVYRLDILTYKYRSERK